MNSVPSWGRYTGDSRLGSAFNGYICSWFKAAILKPGVKINILSLLLLVRYFVTATQKQLQTLVFLASRQPSICSCPTVLKIEPQVSQLLEKRPATELHPHPKAVTMTLTWQLYGKQLPSSTEHQWCAGGSCVCVYMCLMERDSPHGLPHT